MTTESNYDRKSGKNTNASSNTGQSASQTAALKGASLAFGKPPVKPKPDTSAVKSRNGALAAATMANSATGMRGEDERLRPQKSGGSSGYSSVGGGSDSSIVHRTSGHFSKADASGHLKIPGESTDRAISPSYIAAALAASRSAPQSPSHTGQTAKSPSPRRSPGVKSPPTIRSASRQRVVPEDSLDLSSIPPTTSLIGMFEQSAVKPVTNRPRPGAIAIARARPPEIKSPKPIRAQPVSIQPNSIIPPIVAPLRRRSRSVPSTPAKKPIPTRAPEDEDDASSDDSFVSASDTRPIPIPPPARKRRPPSVSPSINSMTVDSLANAIVASSLASSRTASPTKSSLTAPPLPPPRRNKSTLFHHHHNTRTPSPAKGFRQTMRKPKDEEEEDRNMLRMGKKNLMKKHPNKHHEGDRKRWRDSITERERKRYEAVWASNRGLFIGNTSNVTTAFPPPPRAATFAQSQTAPDQGLSVSDSVSNLVVRDIWSRSRLGDEVLSEVWDLVDRSGTGKLSREEFVTGLWLIDQRLKGRKLPIKVSPSVWASSGALIGVKVRGNGRKQQR